MGEGQDDNDRQARGGRTRETGEDWEREREMRSLCACQVSLIDGRGERETKLQYVSRASVVALAVFFFFTRRDSNSHPLAGINARAYHLEMAYSNGEADLAFRIARSSFPRYA